MSVVIVGGNECMTRHYINLCGEYNCKAKVYSKMTSSLKNIGSPDLLVLFTNTVSHKAADWSDRDDLTAYPVSLTS